jgi:hypothetical protein
MNEWINGRKKKKMMMMMMMMVITMMMKTTTTTMMMMMMMMMTTTTTAVMICHSLILLFFRQTDTANLYIRNTKNNLTSISLSPPQSFPNPIIIQPVCTYTCGKGHYTYKQLEIFYLRLTLKLQAP